MPRRVATQLLIQWLSGEEAGRVTPERPDMTLMLWEAGVAPREDASGESSVGRGLCPPPHRTSVVCGSQGETRLRLPLSEQRCPDPIDMTLN